MPEKNLQKQKENPAKITAVHLYERKRVVWLSHKRAGATAIQSYDKWKKKNFPFSVEDKSLSYETMERLHAIYKDMHRALKYGQDPTQKLYSHYRPLTVKTDVNSLDTTKAVEVIIGGAVFTKLPCATDTQKQLDVCFAGRKKTVLALLNDLKNEAGAEYDLSAQARIAAKKANETALSQAVSRLQRHREKSLKAFDGSSSLKNRFSQLAAKVRKLPVKIFKPAVPKL